MPIPFSSTTRSLATDLPLLSWLGWSLSAVLLSIWLGWFFFASVTVFETSREARLEVQSAAHPITAQVSGSVASKALVLGQEVSVGQLLLQLDDRTEQLKLTEEKARNQGLSNQIDAVTREIGAQKDTLSTGTQSNQSAIVTAKARLREAQHLAVVTKDKLRRLAGLRDQGYVTDADWLKANAEANQSQAAVDATSSEIRRLEWESKNSTSRDGARLESLKKDLAKLRGQLELSSTTIARLEQSIEKHKIRSPIAGRIGEIAPEIQVGSYLLAEGQFIARIVPMGDLKVSARFQPSDTMGRLFAHQKARLRLDAFPWTQYGSMDAVVSRVGEEIRDGFQQVDLLIAADNPNIPLQHGLTGQVEVAVETASPATLVLRAVGKVLARPAASKGNTPAL